jgi:hypothetical protein
MSLYTVTRFRSTLSITADLLTIIASATKPLRIYILDVKGMDTVSSANEIVLQRSTGGTTPGGALTPGKVNSGSGPASFLVYTTWSVQPSLSGDVLWRFGPNGNGGIDKYVAIPGGEFPIRVGEQVSLRSILGTANVTVNLLIEEIDG